MRARGAPSVAVNTFAAAHLRSAQLPHDPHGLLFIFLRVDLGDGGGAVAEDDSGGFDADPPSPGFGGQDSRARWWRSRAGSGSDAST